MRSELIVDVQPTDISTALLEDGRLMSLQKTYPMPSVTSTLPR